MKSFTISAPGKLHLLGEHTVVYGKPALLVAVNKRCFVKISPRKNKLVVCKIKNLSESTVFSEKEIIEKNENARKLWKAYKKNPVKFSLRDIITAPIDFVTVAIGESLREMGKNLPCGFTVEITSEIPMGSGMGSSAALAVAIAGSMSYLFTKSLDKKFITTVALKVEQRVHGNPSGADAATSIAGGLLLFEKREYGNKKITPLVYSISDSFQKKLSIIFTGKPEETTGEMVEIVRKAYIKNPKKIKSIFNSQKTLTYGLEKALHEENSLAFASILQQGERNLEELGVVSEGTQKIIRKIEFLGGVAKICGAGGKKENSGIVMIFGVSPPTLKKELKVQSQPIVFDMKGVVKEK